VVQLSYRGSLRQLEGSGKLALGPAAGRRDAGEQEGGRVLARINGWGDQVKIGLFGDCPGPTRRPAATARSAA
jgi:hypothetical protein